MALKSNQPKWDIYEAVVLLGGYLELLQTPYPRVRIIKRISRDLRTMAVNRGLEIGSIYRNENGISYQIRSMESAYMGQTIYVPATKLFMETVELYRSDQEKYQKILEETRTMVATSPNNRDANASAVPATIMEDVGLSQCDFDSISSASADPPKSQQFSVELLSATEKVLSVNFVNGMRKNATIAKKKFKNAYLELTGEEFPESIDVDELVSAVGFEYADKFYAVSEADRQEIQKRITAAVEAGNRVMFYEEVYQHDLDFMTRAGIFSPDLLKAVLKQILPDMQYMRASFSPGDHNSLEQDVINCYGEELMRTYSEIKARLPYTDLYQIRLLCSRSSKFVWAREETYALTDRIQLSSADIRSSLDVVSQDIATQGFSMFQRITVSESAELNPYVTEAAVREALYIKHLAPLYERKRSIITLPGASFHAPAIMEDYCRSLREATLSELQAYEEQVTDRSLYGLSAADDTMIRVDKERFVSFDAIEFDVHAVDEALSLFVQGKIVPLGSVRSFTSFPEVDGYTWNLFLLDSFCKHKSLRFRTMGGPAKSRPVGAIFPIQMQFDSYDALLAEVAAKSGLDLYTDDVGGFFTKNAYTLRRIETSGIVSRAQEIRIQEGIANV